MLNIFTILIGIIVLVGLAVMIFVNLPRFGRPPQGARLERVKQSPNYRDGEFKNQEETVTMTGGKSSFQSMKEFLLSDKSHLKPSTVLQIKKEDYRAIPQDSNVLVWFGHSSFLFQTDGKRFLVDPVFYNGSPVSFVNKAFEGSNVFKPADLPEKIDYLIITHDHWDHLDYATVTEMKDRIGKVIVPLGVGEHFEYWGYSPEKIIELDWDEDSVLTEGFTIHCLPTRHFGGRGLKRNQALWASYVLESPSLTLFMSGDGGYDGRFKRFAERFPNIDLALMENGQYNENWKHIHTMPHELGKEITELGAKHVITIHHSKYALSQHAWDEPRKNEQKAVAEYNIPLIVIKAGEIYPLQFQQENQEHK